MKAPKGLDVDHRNGDLLDNRKSNLRVVTRSENNFNTDVCHATSGFRGVGLHRLSGLYYARMKFHGKVISIGYHKTPELANRARLLKEKELIGVQPRRLTAFREAGIEVSPI